MNQQDVNKPSETDWARVDAMTDAMMDASDIPPLSDEFYLDNVRGAETALARAG